MRRGLVRVGDQKIQMGGARRHRRIAQRVDFVGISHRCHFFLGCLDWPIPATSHCHPQRSNTGGEWQPRDNAEGYVRGITLPPAKVVTPAFTDGSDRTDRPQRTGYPAFAGYDDQVGHEAGHMRKRVVGLIGNRLHGPDRTLWFCRNGRLLFPSSAPALSRLIVAISDDIASG
jgi:hypothetical protein